MRVLIVWTGGVVPAYQSFFAKLCDLVPTTIIAPTQWKHGSVLFSKENNKFKRDEKCLSENKFQLIFTTFLFTNSSHYLIPMLLPEIWKNRPNILYLMDEIDRPNFFIHAFFCKLLFPKIKIIAYSLQNIHNPSYYRWYHRLALLLNLRLTSGIICATEDSKSIIQLKNYNKPLTTIPLWASKQSFFPVDPLAKNKLREKFKIEKGQIVLLYSGSIVEEKGIALLIQALSINPSIHLFSAGNGSLVAEIKKEKNAIQWTHLDSLNVQQLSELYQLGDYIILPSLTLPHWKEQIGRSLIEGILSGCVALGSDSGNIPNLTLFPETTFEQGNFSSLQNLLRSLPLKNHDTIRTAQLLNVEQNYTDEVVADKTISFFKALE